VEFCTSVVLVGNNQCIQRLRVSPQNDISGKSLPSSESRSRQGLSHCSTTVTAANITPPCISNCFVRGVLNLI